MEATSRMENDSGLGCNLNEYNLNETLANFGNNGNYILQDLKPRYGYGTKQNA